MSSFLLSGSWVIHWWTASKTVLSFLILRSSLSRTLQKSCTESCWNSLLETTSSKLFRINWYALCSRRGQEQILVNWWMPMQLSGQSCFPRKSQHTSATLFTLSRWAARSKSRALLSVTVRRPVYIHSRISRNMSGDRSAISKTLVLVDDGAVKRDLWVWMKKRAFYYPIQIDNEDNIIFH